MKTNLGRMLGVVCLCVGCLGLLPLSPLSAQEPKLRATLKGHMDVVFAVEFSSDGDTLASSGGDKTIKLWDVKTGKEQATLNGSPLNMSFLVVSPVTIGLLNNVYASCHKQVSPGEVSSDPVGSGSIPSA